MLSTHFALKQLTNPIVTRGLLRSGLISTLSVSRMYARKYSSFDRPTMMLEPMKRFKSSYASSERPEMTIENALFNDAKMSASELEQYNHGMRIQYLKQQLVEQKESIEKLEKAVQDFKSNFL